MTAIDVRPACWSDWGTLGGPSLAATRVDPTDGAEFTHSYVSVAFDADVRWIDLVGPYSRPMTVDDIRAMAHVAGTRNDVEIGLLGLAAMLGAST